MKCSYPNCNIKLVRRYFYHHPYGYVCLLHDRALGRQAMLASGATLMEAILFEDRVVNWEARERMKESGYRTKEWFINKKGEKIGL